MFCNTCTCDIEEYLKCYVDIKSLVNDSVITCDEIIEMPETGSTVSFNKMESYAFQKNKEKCRYEMAIIQRMVKKHRKYIINITKKGFKNKDNKVYKIS